jgi:hypothetical protein
MLGTKLIDDAGMYPPASARGTMIVPQPHATDPIMKVIRTFCEEPFPPAMFMEAD